MNKQMNNKQGRKRTNKPINNVQIPYPRVAVKYGRRVRLVRRAARLTRVSWLPSFAETSAILSHLAWGRGERG